MEPSNCLLCGEPGNVVPKAFNVSQENISLENAKRLCKLLKLPYDNNEKVLRGLTKCNFCKECKNGVAKLKDFVVKLQSLKSKVTCVEQDFLTELQPAQVENHRMDPISLKTAKARQFLRNCLGMSTTTGTEATSSRQIDIENGERFTTVTAGEANVVENQDNSLENEAEPSYNDNEILKSQAGIEIAKKEGRGLSVKIIEVAGEIKVEFVEETEDAADESRIHKAGPETEVDEDQEVDKRSIDEDQVGNSVRNFVQTLQDQDFQKKNTLQPSSPQADGFRFFFSKDAGVQGVATSFEETTIETGQAGDSVDDKETSNSDQIQVNHELMGFTVPMDELGGDIGLELLPEQLQENEVEAYDGMVDLTTDREFVEKGSMRSESLDKTICLLSEDGQSLQPEAPEQVPPFFHSPKSKPKVDGRVHRTLKKSRIRATQEGPAKALDTEQWAAQPAKVASAPQTVRSSSLARNRREDPASKKRHQCEFCSYSATKPSTLNRHLRIHTGEKPYKCSICNFAADRAHHLERHFRTHTGEKPYKCLLCNFASNTPYHLKRHMRTHTGETPYKCRCCNSAFRRSDALRAHEKSHHVESVQM